MFPLQHPFGHETVLHTQLPDTHVVPDPQTCPQVPQLLLSPCVLTHAPEAEQYVYPEMQLTPQLVPLQVGLPNELPFVGPGHAELHAVPQLVSPRLLSHVPPQLWDPAVHRHFPF